MSRLKEDIMLEGNMRFRTASGLLVNPMNLKQNEILIEDIAHSLARQSRYGGHGNVENYSVAEHSVLVAWWIMGKTRDTNLAFAALMHDSPEAYCQDLMRPVKRHLGEPYAAMERRVTSAIMVKYSISDAHLYHEMIGEADDRICDDEKMVLWPDLVGQEGGPVRNPLGVTLQCYPPKRAESVFLSLFKELRAMRRSTAA
jgi:hypothetical protein